MLTASRTSAQLPGRFRGGVILGVAGVLTILEYRCALRKSQREPKIPREVRNLAIAATAGLVMQFLEIPPALWLARKVSAKAWGLAPLLSRSPLRQTLLSVALLDYGLYGWHILTHKVPFLWRFHLVHHIDLDLDVSTALRFHFGEMFFIGTVAAGTDRCGRRFSSCVLNLADVSVRLYPVSSLERGTALGI
jgi:sterol desaturase/sphingolipid hydroxylase (fatty acid hydroxylase superfamily)